MAAESTGPTPVSNGRAILIGTAWINVPVMVLIFGGWAGLGLTAAALAAFRDTQSPAVPIVAVILATTIPFVAAWLWWSLNVPKWRMWALERTSDWPSLQQAAIAAGLIWDERKPMGRLFARSEIWSAHDRKREADLRLKHPPMSGSV
jgi:hypothetical protein